VVSAGDIALLAGAGVVAGAFGSAGAITSLISYPALLAVGIPPLPANVTNAVALVGSFSGSALGSKPELEGQWPWLRRWAPLIGAGSAAGVALLLATPDRLFGRIVPYLLVVAAAALLFQPRIATWRARRGAGRGGVLLPIGIVAMAIYSGYFGAGSGVMVLALLLATVEGDLPRANALKNMLLGFADLVAALAFIVFGPVHGVPAAVLGAGLLLGSSLGPSFTRRVPGTVVRVLAAGAGIGLAVWFWVTSG
jgi:uncharacterized protein